MGYAWKSDAHYILTPEESDFMGEKENWKHIKATARKWEQKLNKLIEYDDLVQICSIGFIKSIKSFNEDKGYFSHWAKICMDSEVRHYIECNKNRFTYVYLEDLKTDGDGTYEDFIYQDDSIDIEEEIVNKIRNEELEKQKVELINVACERFKKRDIDIITKWLIHGVGQSDLAREYNLSRERVGQITRRFNKLCMNYIKREDLIA